MYLERKEDLSVYYFVKDLFTATPFVKVVDGFPYEDLKLPTVAVDNYDIDVLEYEMGNRDGLRVRTWYIDIFAVNKSQRDEFGYMLLDSLKNGIPVYNYDEGFPPDVSPTKIGVLGVQSKSYHPIKIDLNVVDKLYYRATITFVAQNDIV